MRLLVVVMSYYILNIIMNMNINMNIICPEKNAK